MTDPWDELWETMPVVVYGLRGGKSTHTDWLNKVKAEGDRLKREGLEHHAIAVEYYEKIEAAKKQLFVVPSIHVQDYQRMMRKIKKILEAEDL